MLTGVGKVKKICMQAKTCICRAPQPVMDKCIYFAFFNPRVLRAHGGADYTFGAFAILVVLPPGKNPVVPS